MLHALRSLRSRDYRLLLSGLGIVLIGIWCQRIAIIWLVYRITGSPLLLGVAAFVSEIPYLFVAPFGGLVADRVNRRNALMAVQVLCALQALLLAALAFNDWASYPVLLAITCVQGVCLAFETPLRQSMVPDLLEDASDLPSAVALAAFMNSVGRLLGPLLAGILVARFGEGACFAFSAAGYAVMLAALTQVRLAPRSSDNSQHPSVIEGLRDGARYARRHLPLRAVLALTAVVAFCGLPYLVLIPVYTREVLGADASTLGYLLSAAGAGGVLGLLLIAPRTSVAGFPNMIAGASLLAGAGLLLCGAVTSFWPALLAMVMIGAGIVITATSANIFLQVVATPDKLGRVLGLYGMVYFGMAPIGSLMAGMLGDAWGSRPALISFGTICIACGLYFATTRKRFQAAPT